MVIQAPMKGTHTSSPPLGKKSSLPAAAAWPTTAPTPPVRPEMT